jgi:hypothetical protein
MPRSTVREALGRASSAGLSWPLPDGTVYTATGINAATINGGYPRAIG